MICRRKLKEYYKKNIEKKTYKWIVQSVGVLSHKLCIFWSCSLPFLIHSWAQWRHVQLVQVSIIHIQYDLYHWGELYILIKFTECTTMSLRERCEHWLVHWGKTRGERKHALQKAPTEPWTCKSVSRHVRESRSWM